MLFRYLESLINIFSLSECVEQSDITQEVSQLRELQYHLGTPDLDQL